MAKLSQERIELCDKYREELPRELPEYERNSAGSAAGIAAMLEAAEVECEDLPFDEEGLERVELLLHRVALGEIGVDRTEFEHLVGWFLSQCIIERAGGRWDIHDVCTKKWRPYIILHVGTQRVGPQPFVDAVYAKGVSGRPRRPLSKLLRELIRESGAESAG